jgi:flagellar hook-length control protein FliK
MNPILAALLSPSTGSSETSASTPSTTTQTPSSTDASSAAQFKSQFDQAVAALTNATGSTTSGNTAATNGAQASTAGSTVQTAAAADVLQEALQKKIADLLAKGESVSEVVQQLAASLASTFAQQFGGDPAAIQSQLQQAFATALSPPTSTGPPLSNADLASALAQQFRQVADVAAGVLGETGQSNRLFAGSISDAATTAGVQPAPQISENSPTSADSIANDAAALLASLTASQGDGKTVANNGAPVVGSNGDTLLGRMLARATQSSQQTSTGSQASGTSASPVPLSLTVSALAQATAALDNSVANTTPVAADTSAAAIQRAVANAEAQSVVNSGSAPATTSTEAPPSSLSPAVLAFVKAFSDAIASTSAAPTAKTSAGDNDPGSLLQTTDLSSQAPTIGAFASVQGAVQNDAVSTDGSQSPASLPSQTTVDPNLVVSQLLHGLSLNTVDTTSTVRMRLVPEELGDVSVKLTIEGNSVSAQVMAQTPAAHDALVAGQGQLARAFEDAGLKLTSFNVDLAGGFASFQQQQQQQSSQQGSSNGRTLLGGVDTPETDDALVAAPSFGPPVLAGVSWSALNYLA